jgi:uncharacterized protein YggE
MSQLTRRLPLVFCCWFVLAVALPAQGPAKSEPRKVVVGASATINVKPDTVRIVFSVMTQVGINPREDHERQVKKMKAALAGLSISGIEIHSVPSSIGTVTSEDPNAQFNPMAVPMAPVQTKQVQTHFVVTVRDKDADKLRDKAIKIADAASEMGGTSDDLGQGNRMHRGFNGRMISEVNPGPRLEWLAEHATEARQEAVRKAIKIANENARAAVAEPLQILEIIVNAPEVDMLETRYRMRDDFGNFNDSGLIAISANVRITFGY